MDLNSAVTGTVEATKAVFNGAIPTTVDGLTNITTTVSNTVVSVGTGAGEVLKLAAKFAVNLFFPGTIA